MSLPVIDLKPLLDLDDCDPDEYKVDVVKILTAAGVSPKEAEAIKDPLDFDGPGEYSRYIRDQFKDRYEVQIPATWETGP